MPTPGGVRSRRGPDGWARGVRGGVAAWPARKAGRASHLPGVEAGRELFYLFIFRVDFRERGREGNTGSFPFSMHSGVVLGRALTRWNPRRWCIRISLYPAELSGQDGF